MKKVSCYNCKYYSVGCPDLGYNYDNGNYNCPAYKRKWYLFWIK